MYKLEYFFIYLKTDWLKNTMLPVVDCSSLPRPIQEPHMEVPQIWTRVPYGAKPLREEVLSQRNVPGRCCREENEFGKPGPGGPSGATSRTCSSSSLSLHSVCASRLTGGNAYLRKARGQLCASASVPRGPSVREKYSWQWEHSGEETGPPELPRVDSRSAGSFRDGVATLQGK